MGFFLSFLVLSFARLRARPSLQVDGDLFLVKHLLILREQLTPFDINFSQLKRKLDFTSTRDALRGMFSNLRQGKLLSFGSDNALLELVKRGLPQVSQPRPAPGELPWRLGR